jgi:hypothetical protein
MSFLRGLTSFNGLTIENNPRLVDCEPLAAGFIHAYNGIRIIGNPMLTSIFFLRNVRSTQELHVFNNHPSMGDALGLCSLRLVGDLDVRFPNASQCCASIQQIATRFVAIQGEIDCTQNPAGCGNLACSTNPAGTGRFTVPASVSVEVNRQTYFELRFTPDIYALVEIPYTLPSSPGFALPFLSGGTISLSNPPPGYPVLITVNGGSTPVSQTLTFGTPVTADPVFQGVPAPGVVTINVVPEGSLRSSSSSSSGGGGQPGSALASARPSLLLAVFILLSSLALLLK